MRSPLFQEAVRQHMDCRNAEFIVSADGTLPGIADGSVDFVFAFDAFVHFHNDLFTRYIESIGRILKPRAFLTLHFAHEYAELAERMPNHFNYRRDEEIAALLGQQQLRLTNVQIDFKKGWGSKLVVAQKLP